MKRNYSEWSFKPLYEKICYVVCILCCIALAVLMFMDAKDSFEISSTHIYIVFSVFLISLIGMSWRNIRSFSWVKWRIEWALKPLYEKIFFVVVWLCFIAVVVLLILLETNVYKDPHDIFHAILGVGWLCNAVLSWERSKVNSVLAALLGLAYIGRWISYNFR